MSSGQVAAMMSQQNQMFAGAAQYSHQISASMPNMYGGGQSGGGGFSYGGGAPLGYDFSSRASGGAVSSMGGMAQFGLGAGSLMASMGMMGGTARAALDPFAGGGAMYRMGGRMGMGMGGRLGMGAIGMAPVAGALAFASHAIGSTMSGAQEQAQVEQVLGRQQFMNSSTGGRGFSRPQSMAIGGMMRNMQQLPEMMTSMGELTRIMDKMGGMGLMQGAQNVSDFGQKFKDTIKVLKDMSKVMGTTMEEALPLFGEIRRSGIYSTTDILKNAMNRQITGSATGMNQAQVGQLAQYGAQTNWRRGGELAQGSKHALRVAGQLGTAKRMGLLTEEQIMEHTGGVGGSEGLKQLSAEMVGLAHTMTKSSGIGMVTSIALGEMEEGRFTGKMDEDLMTRYRAGEFSLSDIKKMAGKRRGRKAAMSYYSHDKAMRANLASGMGAEGTTEMLRGALGGRGFTDPSALNLMSQRFGMSQRQAELLPLMQRMPEIEQEMGIRGRSDAKRIAQESFMKENYSWDAVTTKAKKKIANIVTEPFKKFGADLRNSINETVDDFVDDITGRYKVEVTKGLSNLARGAMSDIGTSSARFGEMLTTNKGALQKGLTGGQDFSTGYAGAAVNWATGRTTSGENLEFLTNLTGRRVRERDVGTAGTGVMRGGKLVGGDTDIITSRTYGRGWTRDIGSNEQINQERYLSQTDYKAVQDDLNALAKGRDTEGLSRIKNDLDSAAKKQLTMDYMVVTASNPALSQLKGEERLRAVRLSLMKQSARSGNVEVVKELLGGNAAAMMSHADRLVGSSAMSDVFQGVGKGYEFSAGGEAKISKSIESREKSLRKSMGDEKAEELLEFINEEGGSAQASALMGTIITASDLVGVKKTVRTKRRVGAGKVGGYVSEGEDVVYDTTLETIHQLREAAVQEAVKGKESLSAAQNKLIAKQGVAYEKAKEEQVLTGILNKAGDGKSKEEDFSDKELAYIKSLGITPEELTKEKVAELQGKKALLAIGGAAGAEAMSGLLGDKSALGMSQISARLVNTGAKQRRRIEELEDIKDIKISKKLGGVLEKLESISAREEGATDVEGVAAAFGQKDIGGGVYKRDLDKTTVAQDIGEVAGEIYKLKGKDKERALAVASDEVKDAVGRYGLSKKLGKKGLKERFAAEKFIGEGSSSLDKERAEKVLDILKTKGLDAAAEFMAGDQGVAALTSSGTEEKSRYASQADIANHMAQFGEATKSLASIVASIDAAREKK